MDISTLIYKNKTYFCKRSLNFCAIFLILLLQQTKMTTTKPPCIINYFILFYEKHFGLFICNIHCALF